MYLWIKALHVVSIISWMAALLYLPRLLVYHLQSVKANSDYEIFKTMERKLLIIIAYPAMIIAWLTGLSLILYLSGHTFWIGVKLLAVLGLTGFHFYLAYQVSLFKAEQIPHSEKFYRIINEVPTILMIIAVIMVIVQPF